MSQILIFLESTIFAYSLLGLYAIILTLFLIYGFFQFYFSFITLKHNKNQQNDTIKDSSFSADKLPKVTIQLPIFNEAFVSQRLIDQVLKINYPKELLEIQILDDSTDETSTIIKQHIKNLNSNISYLHRQNRKGFKAGALKEGLKQAKGEFIAIFDADFMPNKDFFKKTIPSMIENSNIGMVQTRWGHLNRNENLLTKLQAFALDGHFKNEQIGRSKSHLFFNFNGTAGIWRKTCIEDAGNWSFDTLTEDLDLSYRAQIKKWKFVYLNEVVSPAELPVTMHALKAQQFRWIKGGAQCFIKNGRKLLKSKATLKQKIHGLFHLFNSTIFLLLTLLGILSIPVMFALKTHPELLPLLRYGSIFIVTTFLLAIYYWTSFETKKKNMLQKISDFVFTFIAFVSISLGIAINNTKGIIEAYRNQKSDFIRTPKFNNQQKAFKKYSNIKLTPIVYFEFSYLVYLYFAIFYAINTGIHALLPFLFLFTFGLSYVFYHTLKELINKEK